MDDYPLHRLSKSRHAHPRSKYAALIWSQVFYAIKENNV